MQTAKNSYGAEIIHITKGRLTRPINAKTFRSLKDKNGWIEVDQQKIVEPSDEFVPPEVANMREQKTTEPIAESPVKKESNKGQGTKVKPSTLPNPNSKNG